MLNKFDLTLNTYKADTCDDPSETLRRTIQLIETTKDGFCKKSDNQNEDDNFQQSINIESKTQLFEQIVAATGVFRGEIGNNINYLLQVAFFKNHHKRGANFLQKIFF